MFHLTIIQNYAIGFVCNYIGIEAISFNNKTNHTKSLRVSSIKLLRMQETSLLHKKYVFIGPVLWPSLENTQDFIEMNLYFNLKLYNNTVLQNPIGFSRILKSVGFSF